MQAAQSPDHDTARVAVLHEAGKPRGFFAAKVKGANRTFDAGIVRDGGRLSAGEILDTIKTYSAVDPAARIYIDLEVSFPNNHWGEDRARASISGIIDIDRTPLPAPMPVPDVQQAIARTEQIARDMGLGDLLDGKAAERPPEEWPTEQVVPEVKTDA